MNELIKQYEEETGEKAICRIVENWFHKRKYVEWLETKISTNKNNDEIEKYINEIEYDLSMGEIHLKSWINLLKLTLCKIKKFDNITWIEYGEEEIDKTVDFKYLLDNIKGSRINLAKNEYIKADQKLSSLDIYLEEIIDKNEHK